MNCSREELPMIQKEEDMNLPENNNNDTKKELETDGSIVPKVVEVGPVCKVSTMKKAVRILWANVPIQWAFFICRSDYCASDIGSSGYSRSGGSGTSDDPKIARMQKIRVLKQYDWLKEQLYWQDIISITDNLYSNGHLKHHERDQIQDRYQPRRKAADMLLKLVLRNPSMVPAFMRILESENRLSYIAEKINMTQLSPEEMKSLDNPSAQKHMKINHNQQRSASDAVEKMVSSLRITRVRQKLNRHVRKHLDLEFNKAVKGSSGIMFIFNVVKPCQKLSHPFATGPDDFAERMFQAYCDLDNQRPQEFEI